LYFLVCLPFSYTDLRTRLVPEDVERRYRADHSRMSANMAVATLNTGMVGGEMGLAFWDCFAIILVVNIMACLLPAWTATFGLTGLRMTTFSRYSFGYWGNLLVVVFSMISTTGWNAINSISGASVLYALSDGKCPQWAGVIIICTTVWIICVLGITWIHQLDAYLWIPPFVVWCVAAGTGAKYMDGSAVKSPTGANGAASAFSFIAVIFSFAVSWINCAADYNVKMPAKTPRWKIFTATYIGICLPTVLVQTLGAALFTGTQVNPEWKAAFLDAGVGGPLKMALLPAGGFGKFLLVLAGLSSIPVSHINSPTQMQRALTFLEQYPKQLFLRSARAKLRSLGPPRSPYRLRNLWLYRRYNSRLLRSRLLLRHFADLSVHHRLLDHHTSRHHYRRAHHLPSFAVVKLRLGCMG
jgi:purine-cytosine permease-like protein